MEIEDPTKVELLESFHREIIVVIKQLEGNESSGLNHATKKLLNAATDEILHLKINWASLTHCSLHTRNIFEIYLILKHIKNECGALEKWHGQWHKDIKDVNSGFMSLGKRESIDFSNLEKLQRLQDVFFEESSLKSSGGFQISQLAMKYKYTEEYSAIYKLSSKLIHPSAMRVMGFVSITVEQNYLLIVKNFGLLFSEKIKEFAQNHIGGSSHTR